MKNPTNQKNGAGQNGLFTKKSYGPIENLEKHLQPDWWKRIFNSMYLKTDSDVVDDDLITTTEIDMFSQILALDTGHAILDLACGQGRHSLELARRGFKNIYGLDRSHYLIQKAKSLNQKENLSVSFKEGDARKLPYANDTFDVVMILGNSFGYFENIEDDMNILKEVYRVLKPNGKFLIDLADGDYLRAHFSPRSWEWLDNKHFVCRERSLAGDKIRLISREVITHIQKGVIVDQFYAERLYSRDDIKDLLVKTGFNKVQLHGTVRSDSQKNQDLGMMEQRNILTSEVVKEWSSIRKGTTDLKHVAVILGDPERPDKIKPTMLFDDDDHKTVDNLKIALSQLTGYKFTYLNNHSTLIYKLTKLKPKIDFVLNLCDEGFFNEPRLELHVPALLEMMNIPYTGSNPQCLSCCYDKSLIRGIANEMGINVASAFYIKPEDNVFEMNIEFPVIVKPNFGDSSFGITRDSVAITIEQLNQAILNIRNTFGYEKPILVEEFLEGKDLTLGILGNPPESYKVLPIVEEDYSRLPPELPKICGYEAKWLEDSLYFKYLRSIPAELPEDIYKIIVEASLKLSERLECRDYCRFDWRLNRKGIPCLLEVNPNPGWCWDGHLAKMAALEGIEYSVMLGDILKAAEERFEYTLNRNAEKSDEKPLDVVITEG